ncbi:MAG: hypothetical protein QM780_15840 [Hyphomicrobium sp.]|uniref:hypothetical protein n=1 Tax=Hyphomicrobium sp. TaxID=82 RepID=UPI0039E64654
MTKFLPLAGAALGLAILAPSAAQAHHWHHRHNGEFRLGYHRAGPPHGYRFGFATYAGDPFARDDYYDGGRCHYLHHRDFCYGPRPFGWIR